MSARTGPGALGGRAHPAVRAEGARRPLVASGPVRGGRPTRDDDRSRLHVEWDGEGRDVWFEVAGGPPPQPTGADATLAASLLPAMRWGRDLVVDGPVSAGLLTSAGTIQDVLLTWDRSLRPRHPWYRRVGVAATEDGGPGRDGTPAGRRGTAAFFTGGVDSFFTATRHREELDALVFVHGFDVALDAPHRAEVADRVAEAAAAVGLPLVEVVTNLRSLGDGAGIPWDDYHGAALATVAHVLADRFDRVLVPATHTYGHLEGLGSHPLLDPLWSGDAVRIEHDGAHATRADKVRAIAGERGARAHLRVCWENRGGAYNCGSCEKCVRTGVAVRVAGVEGRFPTVDPPSLATVAGARVTGRGADWHDLRGDLVRTGANPRLRRAIDVALARHQLGRWRWTRRLVP